ncbi:hypothetical protein [Streptomyces sp. HNM0574]|uniref:hypothetical protein n=1 Tax=Streptomyces sp. HNM0574 TaxID=2714954 RepID=UPI00146B3BBF|nr:hypothetical protein [Streptomyces sp. HNM0574]NLU65835.1 hypothetical protein [Streptomyces sp. HNM0574]
MSGIQNVLIPLWWVAVVALVVWIFRRKARKKREAQEHYAQLRSLAESRGWSYEGVAPGVVEAYQGAAPLPVTARGLAGEHVVDGTHRGLRFRAFEYRYSTTDIDPDSTDTTTVTIHAFWALDLGIEVPDLRIYRDGRFDSVSRGRAMEVGVPQLDQDFHIVSQDEERARAVLIGGLANFLTSDPRATEMPLRLHDGQLITWRERTALNSESFDAPLEYLLDAAGHLGVDSLAHPRQTP